MRFSTLAQWLAWQETLHPSEIELGLERVAAVLQRLQLTDPTFTVITVAGTNGKGSSAAMLESILRAAGYRVGSYTSPHLLRYNERIHIDGAEVSDAALCESFQRIDQARGRGSQEISLTYFEFGTLAAIDILQASGVEIAVLEVGLGGRLDAVNVLDADVALITAIDVDHADWLGADRETIAREKAGILRAGRPAVCSDPRPPAALLDYARQLGVPLQLSQQRIGACGDNEWQWLQADGQALNLPRPALPGDFQLHNAAGVLTVLECLKDKHPLTASAMADGLRQVALAGRFQVLAGAPQRILDVAHNPQSAQVLADNLQSRPCAGQTRLVFAMLADKDIRAVVECLRPQVDHWYLAPLTVPRAASLSQLQATVGEGRGFDSVAAAYAAALADSAPQDRIVVAGSFYTVAAALAQTV
jgi:dihydrofolate synthase/folylpolyglutamate synthase